MILCKYYITSMTKLIFVMLVLLSYWYDEVDTYQGYSETLVPRKPLLPTNLE